MAAETNNDVTAEDLDDMGLADLLKLAGINVGTLLEDAAGFADDARNRLKTDQIHSLMSAARNAKEMGEDTFAAELVNCAKTIHEDMHAVEDMGSPETVS